MTPSYDSLANRVLADSSFLDRGPWCGIHGTRIVEKRCADCDSSTGPIAVGDFFRCSWGYDQTNVDFYEVLEVSSSGKTIKVRQVESTTISENGPSTRVVPVAGSTHRWNPDTLTKHPRRAHDGGWAFKVTSYSTAYTWDGTPAYQTAQGWGH